MSADDKNKTVPSSAAAGSATPLWIGALSALVLLGSAFWGSNLPAPVKAVMEAAPAVVATAPAPAAPAAEPAKVAVATPEPAKPAVEPAKASEPAKVAEAPKPAAEPAKAPEPAKVAEASKSAAEPAKPAEPAKAAEPAKTEVAAAPAAAPPPKPDVELSELLKSGSDLPDMVIGDASAPVTIVEYASMSCPHCAAFHKGVYPELKAKYIDTGKVRLIFREFPLNAPAQSVAMLARCVGPMRYFAFIGAMFEKQDEWLTDDFLVKVTDISKQLGFTDDSLKTCLGDQKVLTGINANREKADKTFDVNSTPTFFVNGVKLGRDHELKDFEAAMAPFMKG